MDSVHELGISEDVAADPSAVTELRQEVCEKKCVLMCLHR